MKAHGLKESRFSVGVNQYMEDRDKKIEELLKEKKNWRERKRYRAKKPKKPGKDSKPQQEQQWKVTDEWINKVLPTSARWRGLPYPFPCPYEEGKSCYQLQYQQCKKNTPLKFKQCHEWRKFIFNSIKH
jgi:hypothetical protein